jgi:methylglutaconyl-CoA hydratase
MQTEPEMTLRKSVDGPYCRLSLNRPRVHNALNEELIEELSAAFDECTRRPDVRLIVLGAEGKSFCSGADLEWMRATVAASFEESRAHAQRLAAVLNQMVACPKPIIARVQGAVLGGGMGLVSACDLVVAAPAAVFGLPEVRLGLVPAMILPFLLRKVDRQRLLKAALTGDRFEAKDAERLGLVDEVASEMDATIGRWGKSLLSAGPQAIAEVKRLFRDVPQRPWPEAQALGIDVIARVRTSPEGQEGMRAFLERRSPEWLVPEGPVPPSDPRPRDG